MFNESRLPCSLGIFLLKLRDENLFVYRSSPFMAFRPLIISQESKRTVLNRINQIKPTKRETESKTTALAHSNPTNMDKNLLEKKPPWRLSSTLCSRLESLNIRENGLICSLLSLSPLRKSMVCSIRLLISSGPDWTCKACARWFGSRFIEFLVRAARV